MIAIMRHRMLSLTLANWWDSGATRQLPFDGAITEAGLVAKLDPLSQSQPREQPLDIALIGPTPAQPLYAVVLSLSR